MKREPPSEVARRAGVPSSAQMIYSPDEIAGRVEAMGRDISVHYADAGSLLVLGLLKGSFIFLADLVRAIRLPLQVDFLVASSYGAGTVSSGEVKLRYDPAAPMEGRHVLLVEDIVESGTTLERVLALIEARNPASLQVCTLLHKRLNPGGAEVRWVGFDAPSDFLVGYGLDHAEEFRHLPFIASL
jgi:hypoxanthine phosphoribosyltransferase